MASFENQVQKLIRQELLRTLEQLIPERDEKFFERDARSRIDISVDPVDQPKPAKDEEKPEEAKSDYNKAKSSTQTEPAAKPTQSAASRGPDFLLAAEFNAMYICILESRSLTPLIIHRVWTAYAKSIAVAHVANHAVLKRSWYVRLGNLLSLFERDGTLKIREAGLFFIAVLMTLLMRELPANSKRINDRVFISGKGSKFDKTMDEIYKTAESIKAKVQSVDECDSDALCDQMSELRVLLCKLQELYQYLLCLEDAAINWPGMQEVMISILQASIGKLGEFITTAWIVFREIECIDDCDCNCEGLHDAWAAIEKQVGQLRQDLGEHCNLVPSTTGLTCASAVDAVAAIVSSGLSLSAGQHSCGLGCEDRQAFHDLVSSLQGELSLLEDKLQNLQPRLDTVAFDLIWPQIATIIYCVDPCEAEKDECDDLREKLGCIVESWNSISGQAKAAKSSAGHKHVSCCQQHDAHCTEPNVPGCSAETAAEIARGEKMLAAAHGQEAVAIKENLAQLHAAKVYGNTPTGRTLMLRGRVVFDSMSQAKSWKMKSVSYSPTHSRSACGCEA